jgi:hypothetical protein
MASREAVSRSADDAEWHQVVRAELSGRQRTLGLFLLTLVGSLLLERLAGFLAGGALW